MKLATIFALMISGTCMSAFADAPNQMSIIQNLDSYYTGNSKYQSCVEQLDAGEPISIPVAYRNRLVAASFAEGMSADCK